MSDETIGVFISDMQPGDAKRVGPYIAKYLGDFDVERGRHRALDGPNDQEDDGAIDPEVREPGVDSQARDLAVAGWAAYIREYRERGWAPLDVELELLPRGCPRWLVEAVRAALEDKS